MKEEYLGKTLNSFLNVKLYWKDIRIGATKGYLEDTQRDVKVYDQ